jgi:hypothetical protein
MNADAKTALCAWGDWVRRGGDATGTEYKSPSLMLLRQMMGGVVGAPPMSDEIPMTVDGILARLRLRDPETYVVIRRYYADGMGCAAVARTMKIARYRVDALRQSGENYVAGVLDSHILVA